MEIVATARGLAKPATPKEIAKEEFDFILVADTGCELAIDSGDILYPNSQKFGYTNPNLHRRIDLDAVGTESDYPFMRYDDDGVPYKQSIAIGVWDGYNSYRTTTTHIHDEESIDCEIP